MAEDIPESDEFGELRELLNDTEQGIHEALENVFDHERDLSTLRAHVASGEAGSEQPAVSGLGSAARESQASRTPATASSTSAGQLAESAQLLATKPRRKTRMAGAERRHQLLEVGRALFAKKGFEGTSVEEIAALAGVSKPVVYEHFGGKEGLYAVVVDREMRRLLDMVTSSLTASHPRELCEQVAFAFLDYIEEHTDGFRILVRDSPAVQSTGSFASLISDIATQVEDILGHEFKSRGFDPRLAPLYARALVGMVALTGEWWLDARNPKKAEVAAHLVNLAWHGLDGLQQNPRLIGHRKQ